MQACHIANIVMVIIILIIVILVIYFFYRLGQFKNKIKEAKDMLENNYYKSIIKACDNAVLRNTYNLLPFKSNELNRNNAGALLETSYNVTLSNCVRIQIEPPIGFDQAIKITGVDPADGINKMFCYFFYSSTKKISLIAFTATWYLSQWKDDLNYQQVPALVLNHYQKGVNLHGGFYGIYKNIRDVLWSTWNSFQDKSNQLIITGHSLGGALSTICAFDFSVINPKNRNENKPSLWHYSFGAPLQGTPLYASIFNQNIVSSWRIANTADIVTQVPPPIIKDNIFEHCGIPDHSFSFNRNLDSYYKNHVVAYSQEFLNTDWPSRF